MVVKLINSPKIIYELKESSNYIFEIVADTKVLLEITRHRDTNIACKSSRYTLNKGQVIFEEVGDIDVDRELQAWKIIIEGMIKDGKPNDVVAMMLPQAYQYKWIMQFNTKSLINFLGLRLDKHAHYKIREVALEMYNSLPDDHKFLINI